MSKIYSKYLEIKSNNLNQENTLYLFKSGIFFIFIAEDAIKAASLLNLRLSNLNDSIFKCAIPISSFEKYQQLLKNLGYNLQIVDLSQGKLLSSNYYINNEKVQALISQIINTDTETLSISEAYELLSQIKSAFTNIQESGEAHGK